ncbi:ATP-binding protein, partial [Teichococcus aestuarii]|uniref:ATP-binding protein n=1 Tax=Teichococcus aestuarii TaxID=568898 RepID=UPI00361D91D6
ESGAQAVHPGYGFLSENATFVAACAAAGVRFLGPTTEQMAAFGLKHRARELAQQQQVPLLPGSGLLTDCDAALQTALAIGYPVMLKSTAGGGGIGMQRCNDAGELQAAFERVKRLAGNNFADDGVFLEKFIARARHIEVQVFGDGQGNVLALGERDCSAQRRNQKVIEET